MKPKLPLANSQVRLGEISGLHGVSGWVKVFSDAQPRENVFSYRPWLVYSGDKVLEVEVLHWRKQGKTLVAQLKGLNSRESARELIGAVIAIEQSQLPELADGEFYWSQLVGMDVVSRFGGKSTPLGRVADLLETGANDVLMVRGDSKEHLVPWVPGEFVTHVDLDANQIEVDWDPDF